MRRHDSSSGEMEEAADNTPAVDSASEATPMEVTAPKSKHVRIPPPNVATNGIKSNSTSPQKPAGRQSRPQSANRGPGAPVRYFVIKSINRENVERSIDQGVWSTQVGFLTYACTSSTPQSYHGCAVCEFQCCCCCVYLTGAAPLQRHNEQKLREAFERSKDVFLIFSVNMSGHFQGYARMISVGNQNQVCFSFNQKLPSRLPHAGKHGLSCLFLAKCSFANTHAYFLLHVHHKLLSRDVISSVCHWYASLLSCFTTVLNTNLMSSSQPNCVLMAA